VDEDNFADMVGDNRRACVKLHMFPNILIGCLLAALPVHAHHSDTEFDFMNPSMEIEGKLLEVAWQNLHVRFELQTVDQRGRTVVGYRQIP
jgi:hypothetical protein